MQLFVHAVKSALFKAAAISGLLLISTQAAHASDYGCKVLLCLANPNGPEAVSECRPPIEQLWDDLSHDREFPSCEMSGNSYAQPRTDWYDPCPSGTNTLSSGEYAIQASALSNWKTSRLFASGIGDGNDIDFSDSRPPKVCVGNKVGQTSITTGSYKNNDSTTYSVGVYDRVVMLDPSSSPRVIDVFVSGSLYRRVRW